MRCCKLLKRAAADQRPLQPQASGATTAPPRYCTPHWRMAEGGGVVDRFEPLFQAASGVSSLILLRLQ
jgi:hypothetical protein